MSDYTEIDYELRDHVAVITINRPEARNALTYTTYDELSHAVENTTARCLIVTGADPAFCSGDDVKQVMLDVASRPAGQRRTPKITPAAATLLETDIPIIAAVNGAAVGWGMELALMADIRIASERAKFGELFVKRGLCSDVAGLARLAELVGRELAADLLYTGRIIDGPTAKEIGLVSRLVDHEKLMPAALELAGAIAANPPLAVQRLKAGLRLALDPDWHELGAWVTASLGELFATEDHREGVAAFLEKREPDYVGR